MKSSNALRNPVVLYIVTNALLWVGLVAFDGLFSLYLIEELNWSSSQSFLPVALVHIFIGLLELPTGAYADVFGQLKSTKVGISLIAVAFLGLVILPLQQAVLNTMIPFVFSFVFAAGWTFTSGAFSAWLVQELHARKRENELNNAFANANVMTNLGTLSAVLFYSNFMQAHLRAVWIVAAAFCISALFLVSLFAVEDRVSQNQDRMTLARVFETIKSGIEYYKTNKAFSAFLWMNASIYALIAVVTQTLLVRASTLSSGTIILESLKNNVWVVAMVCSLLGALLARRMSGKESFDSGKLTFIGNGAIFVLLVSYSFIPLSSRPASIQVATFLFVIASVRFLRGVSASWITTEVNRLVKDNSIRATALSINSILLETFAGCIGVIASLLAARLRDGLMILWAICACLSLLIYLFSLLQYKRRQSGV